MAEKMETSKFDVADYLDSNEMIAEYLNAVLAEGNESDAITAIGHIAKSIGMTKIAKETGLSRPNKTYENLINNHTNSTPDEYQGGIMPDDYQKNH